MGRSKFSRIQRMENEARDGIVTVLCDQAIRKLTAYEMYQKVNTKEANRAFASGVAFMDSAVLTAIHLDENADIRQEYNRIKNYVVNSSTDEQVATMGEQIDKLSHISVYMKQEQVDDKVSKAAMLADFYS